MNEIVASIIEFAKNKPGILAIFDLNSAGSLLSNPGPGGRETDLFAQ